MERNSIEEVKILHLWGKYDFCWDGLNPDVNVIAGINGGGKSTLLRIIYCVLKRDSGKLQCYGANLYVSVSFKDGSWIVYEEGKFTEARMGDELHPYLIKSFDTPVLQSMFRRNESGMDQHLDRIMYPRGKALSNDFYRYRLRATLPNYSPEGINRRISWFLNQVVNPLFVAAGKRIVLDEASGEVALRVGEELISLKQASEGEKQMLYVLFNLFLTDDKHAVVLLDNPEISMSVGWQQTLIDLMQKVNPNAQLLIATNSPSVVGNGWLEQVQLIENISL